MSITINLNISDGYRRKHVLYILKKAKRSKIRGGAESGELILKFTTESDNHGDCICSTSLIEVMLNITISVFLQGKKPIYTRVVTNIRLLNLYNTTMITCNAIALILLDGIKM